VLLDRFDVIYMDYPEDDETEKEIVVSKGKKMVETPDQMLSLMTRFIRSLRRSDKLEKVPSIRATIGLYERAQSTAYLSSRDKVEFSDIEDSVVSVLAHRIRLKPSLKYIEDINDFVKNEFDNLVNEKFSDLSPKDKGGDG